MKFILHLLAALMNLNHEEDLVSLIEEFHHGRWQKYVIFKSFLILNGNTMGYFSMATRAG